MGSARTSPLRHDARFHRANSKRAARSGPRAGLKNQTQGLRNPRSRGMSPSTRTSPFSEAPNLARLQHACMLSQKQGREDSNPQPADLESAALPLELLPYRIPQIERFESLPRVQRSREEPFFPQFRIGQDPTGSPSSPSGASQSAELVRIRRRRYRGRARSPSHGNDVQTSKTSRYLMILATTPAPTVRPPSRIAKRRPSSMAIAWISSTLTLALSPGMHISAPSTSVLPVTSVVRK